jgi:pantoate--beta-alanine ligase
VALERIDRPAAICVAAWFGKVRLIDNMEIQTHHPDGGASI